MCSRTKKAEGAQLLEHLRLQQRLLATYLIPCRVGKRIKLGSESSCGAGLSGNLGISKSGDPNTSELLEFQKKRDAKNVVGA